MFARQLRAWFFRAHRCLADPRPRRFDFKEAFSGLVTQATTSLGVARTSTPENARLQGGFLGAGDPSHD